MSWLRSCFLRMALVCIALTSCSSLFSKGQPSPVYDVRSAVVLAGPNMPAPLLAGVGDRVNAAINATVRTNVYPRVILTIRILSAEKGQGYNGRQYIAKVTVDAASVEDGSVIAVSSFSVTSLSNNKAAADEILAEDIAGRIRSIFSLNAGHA
ncbi:hypothetical protein [Rhizobium sp. S96]|uniref:hypothetical protein n=1 Tax=Rhizobium sp. S96 TaxID=3055140 RepID=UPI0025AA7E22|nr:hypothetical protein [Rhizobium sp. S96]MDM9623496.1 hypothetical protein [Rhizobium sp. S96]